MGVWIKWSASQEAEFAKWVAERPQVIRDMVARYGLRPDKLYRMKKTDQRVVIQSLNEDGTVRVSVDPQFNQHKLMGMFGIGHGVFGVSPEDLEECDWEGEVVQGDEISEDEARGD